MIPIKNIDFVKLYSNIDIDIDNINQYYMYLSIDINTNELKIGISKTPTKRIEHLNNNGNNLRILKSIPLVTQLSDSQIFDPKSTVEYITEQYHTSIDNIFIESMWDKI